MRHVRGNPSWPIRVSWPQPQAQKPSRALGAVTGQPVNDRLAASVAAAVLSVDRGARVVRVHDVKETVAALKVWFATISIADGLDAAKGSST